MCLIWRNENLCNNAWIEYSYDDQFTGVDYNTNYVKHFFSSLQVIIYLNFLKESQRKQ